MTRIASSKYIGGSRGQPCSLRIPGYCDGGGETTVFAHIRDRHTGRSIKASDISGADSCFGCHSKFDGHNGAPLSHEDWLFYALRGIQETIENRIARGLLFVSQDMTVSNHDKPVKPRKPKAERRAVPQGRALESHSTFPPKGSRKIQSNNPLRKNAK